jgi:hypothetical protein
MVSEGFSLIDIYSTKGLEYLIAALFFVCLVFFVKNIILYEPWKRRKVKWDDLTKNKDVQSDSDKI